MEQRKSRLYSVGKLALTMARGVTRHGVKFVAERVAGRIREGVDLEQRIPSRPVERNAERPERLVVTPPEDSGTSATASDPRQQAASQPEGGEPATVTQTPLAAERSSPSFQLFQRVRVMAPGGELRVGNVYDRSDSTPPRFDVLTYADDGVPHLLEGIGASDLALEP